MPNVIKERIPRTTKRQNQQRVMRNWSGILIAQNGSYEGLYRGTIVKREITAVTGSPSKRRPQKRTKSDHN